MLVKEVNRGDTNNVKKKRRNIRYNMRKTKKRYKCNFF